MTKLGHSENITERLLGHCSFKIRRVEKSHSLSLNGSSALGIKPIEGSVKLEI